MTRNALDPRIEAVREQFGLDKDDFWQIPQNKQWVCKHAALEIVATKANVIWTKLEVIESDTANGIAVMAVGGKLGEREEWATGEASPKNNKNAYPWAMAEKRAKDRVVLKLVGIHGLVYSEDEMPPSVETRTTDQRSETGKREVANQTRANKNTESRDRYAELEALIRGAGTIDILRDTWLGIQDDESIPDDWLAPLSVEKNDRYRELAPTPAKDAKSHLDNLVTSGNA